jgi:hypothetical protein
LVVRALEFLVEIFVKYKNYSMNNAGHFSNARFESVELIVPDAAEAEDNPR